MVAARSPRSRRAELPRAAPRGSSRTTAAATSGTSSSITRRTTSAAASRDLYGRLIGRRGHWTPQRYSRGSYTAYHPGQFTTLAGLEAQPAGALKFAGEHTDSFYASQGFMEGACNSGIRAAQEIFADIRARRI